MLLLWIVLLPFIAAPLAELVSRQRRTASAWLSGAATALALALLLSLTPAVLGGTVIVAQWPWLPQWGLNLSLRLDGLSLLFALLVLGIGLLVVLYARYYLSPRDAMGRFYAYLLLFMGAMLGVVLSGQMVQMMVFWEATSLSSFLLIGYWSARQEARAGARMALAVTGAGGFALLAGVLLLGHVVGSYEIGAVLAAGDAVRASPLYLPILLLVLFGALTKSAQFPFHFWLPRAMAAPTPVSAYLHSATMVNAGLFVLARLWPVLAGTPQWFAIVGGLGLATLVIGAGIALFKHDLKGLLAYSTVSHLGLIALLLGMNTRLALVAALFHLINHAIFKASLFMAAGIIDHETGTRDMRRLQGLWRAMPITGLLAIVSSAAMAGVPLFNGFLSKEMFFAEAATLGPEAGWWIPALATAAGAFAVAYSIRFVHDVFFNGPLPGDLPHTPHEPPRFMRVPVELLAVLCVAIGIAPNWTVQPFLRAASAAALAGPVPAYSLAIWHGFNAALLMSAIALAGGALVYALRQPLFAQVGPLIERLDARIAFDALLRAVFAVGEAAVRVLDPARLQPQAAILVAAALLAAAAPWWGAGVALAGPLAGPAADPVSIVLAAALLLGVVLVMRWQQRRYRVLLPLGVVGLIVALVFVKFSAPDLALTQLMVELVSVLLLLLALYFLPQRSRPEASRARRLRDGALALLAGAAVAALTYAVLTRPYDTALMRELLSLSVPGGGGHNVVNVILVDFRGYDTLGEITVLAIAALAVFALLQGLRLPAARPGPWDADAHPAILATLMRLLLPLMLLVALFILLRGHNAPGGGFIAGLIVAIALVAQYLANGHAWMDARLHPDTRGLIALGLALALVTGLAAFVFARPFLTSAFGHVHLPLLGEVELASAMAFDLGVFAVVVGATLLMLVGLGRVHRREPPRRGGKGAAA